MVKLYIKKGFCLIKNKDEDSKIFFNITKLKTDKDYFILLVLFLLVIYGVLIMSIGFYGFDLSETRTLKNLSIMIIDTYFLLNVLFCKKNFKK